MDTNNKNEVIEDFGGAVKGQQIGYGPTTQIMSSDTLILNMESSSFEKQVSMNEENLAELRETIDNSHLIEKGRLEEKNSISSVLNGDQSFKDFFSDKMDSLVKPDGYISPEQSLENKYRVLNSKFDNTMNTYKNRKENGFEPSTDNDLEFAKQEAAQSIRDEVDGIEKSPVNDNKNAKNTLDGANEAKRSITVDSAAAVEEEMNQQAFKSKNKLTR